MLDRLVGRHLKIEPRDLRRAHAEQRKPALVARVDELVAGRRRLGEDPEPAERVDAFVDVQHAIRNRRTADAVKSIAAGDEIAVHLVFGVAMPEAKHRAGRVERADRHVLGLEVERTRDRRRARRSDRWTTSFCP